MNLSLQVKDSKNNTLTQAQGEDFTTLVHTSRYHKGDQIIFTCDVPGFYELLLEDTLPPAIVYVRERAVFTVPFGKMNRIGYSPRAFVKSQHLISARAANPAVVNARRNLALNPLDQHGDTGMWPHACANVETRNEALFAARNAIDGIHANLRHYPFPFQSWGINKNPNAQLTISFGTPVTLDEIVLTLRADYPHDSYWTQATAQFSDDSREILSLTKTQRPQHFPIKPRTVTSLTLTELIKHEDESPYPALTQIEAWGTIESKVNK